MKLYIAGAGGMLGDAFYKHFINNHDIRCSDINVNEPWLSFLDFRDYNAYADEVRAYNPDILVHLGAHTDLEYCELNEHDAYLTNTISVEYAVHIANALKIPVVYISTAGIFDGQASSYDDWATPNPLGVYARSKYMAERFVVENAEKYFVFRAGWMMGGGLRKDKKFIGKLMRQIAGGARHLHIVDDKDGTPTYTHDFAANVELLLSAKQFGLYNMVCGGVTSRMEVATELIATLSQEKNITVNPVSSSFFSKDYFAPRPPSERLINKRLNILNLNIMRNWKVALHEYVRNFENS